MKILGTTLPLLLLLHNIIPWFALARLAGVITLLRYEYRWRVYNKESILYYFWILYLYGILYGTYHVPGTTFSAVVCLVLYEPNSKCWTHHRKKRNEELVSSHLSNQPTNQPQRKRCTTFWKTSIGTFISSYFELCHEHLKSHLYSCVHFSLLNDGRHTIIYPFIWKWNESNRLSSSSKVRVGRQQ